jgi:glycosyltransferase involved in cell wall biosynthesis
MASNDQSSTAPRCLSVIMPVYNEERTLDRIVRDVLNQPVVEELVVVDDGSSDQSWATLQALAARDGRIRIFRNDRNRGKGAAVREGVKRASSRYVVIQDADLEYDPAEYPVLLAPMIDGKADVVFGSRFLGAGSHRVLYFWHYVGNRALTLLSNMLTNVNLSDIECCYKAFRREVIQSIKLEEDRFGMEPELAAKVAKLRLRIYEVSVSYHGRTYEEGKKITWRDGFSAIRCILKYGLTGRLPTLRR